ncbi:MAG: CDP-alcohol phosphatidyltransferase family protein [Cypionkella sp.]
MIDAKLLPLQHHLLALPARYLVRMGVKADHISILGFGLGALSVPALAFGAYGLALVLFLLNRLADGLDGEVARAVGATDRGAFLDVALDFVVYALFPLGFALADPAANALSAAVLIAAFMGTGSSFLAFATIAAKRGTTASDYPTKGIHYLGGLTEGFETIAIFVLMCLIPFVFPFLAYIFAAACVITTVLRWHQGWTEFA